MIIAFTIGLMFGVCIGLGFYVVTVDKSFTYRSKAKHWFECDAQDGFVSDGTIRNALELLRKEVAPSRSKVTVYIRYS
jgi:hypothetical protein